MFSIFLFFNWPNPGPFSFILIFSKYCIKNSVVSSGIQSQIVGVEGKDTDHYTTTMAQAFSMFAARQKSQWESKPWRMKNSLRMKLKTWLGDQHIRIRSFKQNSSVDFYPTLEFTNQISHVTTFSFSN